MKNSIKHYDLKYAKVHVFENYLINELREGASIELPEVHVLQDLLELHYNNKELVYISNRLHSYSVNPLIYLEVAKLKNILGMAIVTNDPIKIKSAEFEKRFYKSHFEIFATLEEAVFWANNLVEKTTETNKK